MKPKLPKCLLKGDIVYPECQTLSLGDLELLNDHTSPVNQKPQGLGTIDSPANLGITVQKMPLKSL